jgi:serine protease Do
MRFYSAIPILAAGLLSIAPRAPAQYLSPQTFNFARDFGAGTGSHLGVSLRDINPDRAQVINFDDSRGVEVVGVEKGSPAERAGIKPGDVLVSYNGENIMGAQQLGRLVSETPRGRKVKIEYWREGKVSTVSAITAGPTIHGTSPTKLPGDGMAPDIDFPGIVPGPAPNPRLTWTWTNQGLGMECESIDSQLAEYFGVKRGVLVRSVAKDSAAARAGLRAGDVVTRVEGRAVSDPREIRSYAFNDNRTPKAFAVDVTRDHKPVKLMIEVSE